MNQTYKYINHHGNEVTVHCTKLEFLTLKLYYGITGLTTVEYQEYKELTSQYYHKNPTILRLENEVSNLINILTEEQLEEFQGMDKI